MASPRECVMEGSDVVETPSIDVVRKAQPDLPKTGRAPKPSPPSRVPQSIPVVEEVFIFDAGDDSAPVEKKKANVPKWDKAHGPEVTDGTQRRKRRCGELGDIVTPPPPTAKRNEEVLTKLVDSLLGTVAFLSAQIAELKSEMTSSFDTVKAQLVTLTPPGSSSVPTGKAIHPAGSQKEKETTQQWSEVVRRKKNVQKTTVAKETPAQHQGNGPAAPIPSYREVAARRLIGHWKAQVVVHPHGSEMEPEIEVASASKEAIKKLTTQTYQPERHEVVVLRFEKMASRKKISAGEWRKILREKQITPHGILFPRLTTLELVLPKDQEQKTRAFFASLGRNGTPPDPYARRDGQSGPLPPDVLERTVQQRISMLEHEWSMVTVRYIESTVTQGLEILPERLKEANRHLFEEAQKKKGLLARKSGDKAPVVLLTLA